MTASEPGAGIAAFETMRSRRRRGAVAPTPRGGRRQSFGFGSRSGRAVGRRYYKWQNYKSPGPLIYSTDEQDPNYVAALQASLAKINPTVTRADDAFSACKDNFCIYCNIVRGPVLKSRRVASPPRR